MDYIFLVITIVLVLIGAIMTIFLAILARKTKYIPTVLLGTFFGVFTIVFSLTLPTFWIPYGEQLLAEFFLNSSVVLLFLMFPLLILAFEGMRGRFFSPLTTFYISFTTFAISFLVFMQPWGSYWGDYMYYGTTTEAFDIVFALYAFSAIIIVLARLVEFIRGEGSERDKRMTIIALIGFLVAMGGGVGIFLLGIPIPNLDYLFVVSGLVVIASIYMKYPHSFFLSNTRISAIMLINSENKIPYLTIGEERGVDAQLAAAGLGGIMMLLQEILGSERPPTELFHKDKGILLEHDMKYNLTGVIVADQVNEVLRRPLKYAVSLFVKQFKDEIT
ncbi:MAG: hypothetical protein HWN65_23440, partial [Candidatus Helarchaeota archaeon]|nr:hypothetical protein [Candidatus Helarchaeota archaeon]